MSNASRIPPIDFTDQLLPLEEALTGAFRRVLLSKQYILGPEVAAFEGEVAAFLETPHAVGCNSGTDALVLALRALGLGPGDEVITSPFTFFATAEAISAVGATPVFADIDPATLCLDAGAAEAAVTARTRALLPVHLFGRPCPMDDLMGVARRHGLRVVEDCAQAFGARHRGRRVGAIGDLGCFSFFPTKNLSGFGDGGLVTAADPALADAVRRLRVHGARRKYHNEAVGYNSRLDELQAALLRVRLPQVEAWNRDRARLARAYGQRLAGIPGLVLPDPCEGHVFNQYTIRIQAADGRPGRDEVQAALADRGVDAVVYYPVPCHRLPVYAAAYAGVACPRSEAACAEVLSLPFWPGMAGTLVDRVSGDLADILGGRRP